MVNNVIKFIYTVCFRIGFQVGIIIITEKSTIQENVFKKCLLLLHMQKSDYWHFLSLLMNKVGFIHKSEEICLNFYSPELVDGKNHRRMVLGGM